MTYDQLNEEVNFMYNEALTYDEHNNPMGINYDKVQERYGEIPNEYYNLENDIKNTREKAKKEQTNGTSSRSVGSNYKDRWDCNAKELTKQIGSSLPPALIATIVDYWHQGKKKKAFTKIAKAGVKGNAVGIAYTIISTDVQCTKKYGYL